MQAPGSKANEIAHCLWVIMDLDVGAADTVCVAALVSHQKDKKFRDVFVYFSLCLSGTDSEQQSSAYRPLVLSGSSCIAAAKLVRCGKA